ncbi:MAG TPA: ABC-2 family transporter protein [Patescibacteria group bacterium]|nr:ABC-2 family transporter protein [Patescibacteria group bacterium]
MNKYWQIFKISLTQELAYRLNFIMWRLRNIIQILVFFFLWDAVFLGTNQIFGYTRIQIFTYAFVLIIVRAIIFSIRSNDIAGQVANGELTNMLLKPINYFKYWITRDFAYKFLNIIFGIVEVFGLILILKPNIFLQTNPFYFIAFIASLIIAIFIYFIILSIASFVPFWVPEIAWGAQFLTLTIVEFLSGASFPIDVFPNYIYQFLRFTPLPYLIFIPIKIYLGNFSYSLVFQSLVIGIIWVFILWRISNEVWKRGLKVYEGVGR